MKGVSGERRGGCVLASALGLVAIPGREGRR